MNKEPLKIFGIKDECIGCGACVSACSKGCLSLEWVSRNVPLIFYKSENDRLH